MERYGGGFASGTGSAGGYKVEISWARRGGWGGRVGDDRVLDIFSSWKEGRGPGRGEGAREDRGERSPVSGARRPRVDAESFSLMDTMIRRVCSRTETECKRRGVSGEVLLIYRPVTTLFTQIVSPFFRVAKLLESPDLGGFIRRGITVRLCISRNERHRDIPILSTAPLNFTAYGSCLCSEGDVDDQGYSHLNPLSSESHVMDGSGEHAPLGSRRGTEPRPRSNSECYPSIPNPSSHVLSPPELWLL